MVWDDEFIAAALGASEGGVRHGACRPFWSALANLVSLGRTIIRPNGRKSSPVMKPLRSLAFASTLAEMPRWARQLAGALQLATVADNVATTCLDGVAGSWLKQARFHCFQAFATVPHSGQIA
jgi:hypothetical protein